MAGEARAVRDTDQYGAGMSSEEFYLTLRNMELSLDQFLLDNGIFLDGTTRVFLANMRDVTSVMAERLSEEMRDRAPKCP